MTTKCSAGIAGTLSSIRRQGFLDEVSSSNKVAVFKPHTHTAERGGAMCTRSLRVYPSEVPPRHPSLRAALHSPSTVYQPLIDHPGREGGDSSPPVLGRDGRWGCIFEFHPHMHRHKAYLSPRPKHGPKKRTWAEPPETETLIFVEDKQGKLKMSTNFELVAQALDLNQSENCLRQDARLRHEPLSRQNREIS
eukprot:scaffold195872_cov31-Tisochrysis_lutea.AAC.2